MNEHSIFLAALEIADPAERASYLDQACADDPALRKQVEALFAAHERSGEFLDVPVLKQLAGDSGDPNIGGETSVYASGTDGEIDLSFLEVSTVPGSLGRLLHYDVREVVGRGGCGIVLKAFDEKLQRIVAIKVMAPELAATSPARKRFLRKARATAAIRHPNVVNIYAVEEQPLPFLVMEFIEGQTLQQRLDQHGPLDVRDVLSIGQRIASGLAAAHAKGLIHRDIKPGNILLEEDSGDVKLTDFGLAQFGRRRQHDAKRGDRGHAALYVARTGASPRHRSAFGSVQPGERDVRDVQRPAAVPRGLDAGGPQARGGRSSASHLGHHPRDAGLADGDHQHAAGEGRGRAFCVAQEVSDLLARCLADIERLGGTELSPETQAMIPPPPAETAEPTDDEETGDPVPAKPEPRTQRRIWVAAAAVLLLLAMAVGVTDATGVTDVRGTVIRLFSASGTLVIEVDDPSLSVTIDGQDVVITGAGPKEIRLKPGQYKVLTSKDGEVVRQQLVTVTSHGRRVVRVNLEPSPKAESAPSPGQTSPAPIDADQLATATSPPPGSDAATPVEDTPGLSASQKAETVRRELRRLNPDFQGVISYDFEDGRLVGCKITGGVLPNLAPLSELDELRTLGYEALDPMRDAAVLREMTNLELINNYSAATFRLAYPANKPSGGVDAAWFDAVRPLLARTQVDEVTSKLKELNPNFNGKLDAGIEEGRVTSLRIVDADVITDLSPLRAFEHLQSLKLELGGGHSWLHGGSSWLTDLSPLSGLKLEELTLDHAQLTDLTPLKDMPLVSLSIFATDVRDLSPLHGLPLKQLEHRLHAGFGSFSAGGYAVDGTAL